MIFYVCERLHQLQGGVVHPTYVLKNTGCFSVKVKLVFCSGLNMFLQTGEIIFKV